MKKFLPLLKLLSLMVFSFLATPFFGQVSNYTFAQSNGTYTPITGGTVVRSGNALDTGGALVTLPTAFTFNGTSVTQVYVKDDGYLGLGVTSFSSTAPISNNGTATGIIAALACDLMDANAAGTVPEIRWEQIGNEIIFQWNDIARYVSSTSVEIFDFQIRLNTSSGQINIIYSNFGTTNSTTNYTPQVGLRGASNTDYNSRRLTTTVPDATPSWDHTVAATNSAHTVRLTATSPAAFPANGLTFTWSPLVVSPCTTPDAPTLAVTGTTTATSLSLAITAPASNVPTGGYVVVRSTSATPPTVSNGTPFATGGAYTVVSNGTATPVAETGLTSNTKYYYYVYSQNTGCTGAPFYSAVATTSPTTCAAAPTGLSVGAITSSGANFTWTSPVGGNAASITSTLNIYSNSGATTLVKSFSGVTSVYTLSDALISPATQYWYQIVNSNGICSTAIATGTFTTACAAVTTFPANEPFTSYLPSVCWNEGDAGSLIAGPSTIGNSTVSDWVEDGFLNAVTTGAAKINIYNANRAEWLISTYYTIPAGYSVKYSVGATQWNTTTALTTPWEADDFVELLVSTSNANWTVLKTYNSSNVPSHSGQIDAIDLSAYSGQTVHFAFRAFEGSTNGSADIDFFVDNFTIEATPNDAVDYANIQFPGVSTTTPGTSVDIYGQAYEPGVTEAAGPGAGLVVWYSKNATDVDPSSAAWTGTWTLATFNTNVGNNDEWKGTITPIAGQANTYYSFRYQLNGGPMKYGGYSATGGGFWNGTTNKNGILSVNYEVYTDAISPNNTVNNTIDVYLKDYDGINNFYTDNQTSIWMYAGVRTSTTSWQYISTTNPVQNLNNTATLVEFVRTATNPNIYKATLKFADYFCIPTGTTVTGIDLLFRNQLGTGGNNQTADLFLDLGDAVVAVNALTIGTATAVTTNSATIGWTAPTSGAIKGYDYYYSTSNTAPTAGTTPSGSTVSGTTTANLTSLLSGTAYYFWARTKSCDGSSAWSAVGSFTTLCNVTPITVAEGFNAATIPACWSLQYPASTNISFVTGGAYPTTSPAEGSHMVRYNSYNTSTDETLRSLPMSSTGSPSVDVEFMWRNDNTAYTGAAYDTEGVQVQYSLDGTTWVDAPGGFFKRVDTSLPAGTAVWAKKTVTLPAAVGNTSTFYVGFNFISEYGNNMYMDAAVIQPTPQPITVTSSAALPLCAGNSTTLTASSTAAYAYTWSPATGLSSTSGASVVATPAVTTTYTVTGTLGSITATKNFTVTVNPAPTNITMTETAVSTGGVTACDLDYVKLDAIGGKATKVAFSEDFTSLSEWAYDGANVRIIGAYLDSNDAGGIAPEGGLIWDSGNGTVVNSWYFFPTSLADYRAIDITGFNTLQLNFKSILDMYSNNGTISVEVSADKSGWTSIWSLTSGSTSATNVGPIDLNTYIGTTNTIYIRFVYTGKVADFTSWVIDDVLINGDLQSPITWSPATGLYTDAALTTLYTGQNLSTVYAAPEIATTYTATASLGTCSKTATSSSIVTDKKSFTGLDATSPTLWNVPANWSKNTIPTITKCVSIPTGKTVVVNIRTAEAKNVTVNAGAKLTIQKDQVLTVKETFTNNAAAGDVMIESDGSLLQNDDVIAVANSGAISARREITVKDNNQYNYLISPLIGSNLKTNVYENQTTGALSSSASTLYHNEANNKFFTSTGAYIQGRSLAVKEPAATVVPAGGKINARFTGVPMNGAFTYTLANSNTAGTGYNLIGNPYPSNIDLDAFYNFKTNEAKISATFYFWDNTVNTETKQLGNGYDGAAYAIFNAEAGGQGTGVVAGSLATGSPSGTKEPTKVVKPGQGFMVRSISASDKILDFSNDIRIAEAGTVFFGKPEEQPKEDDRFYLKLTAPTNIVTQVAAVYFDEGNSAFAEDDSEMNGTPSDVLYTVIGDKKAIINGRAPFTDTDVIPLGSRHFTSGLHTIALGKKEGIFASSQAIYLKDKQTGIITNLSEGAHTFAAQAGESTGRFEIVYKPGGVLATDAAVKESIIVYRDGQDFVVKVQTKKITMIELYDAAGRMIRRMEPNNTEVRIEAATLVNGSYILRISQNGEVSVKKVIK